MNKLAIISMYSDAYHINMNEADKYVHEVKYVRIPNHKNDCKFVIAMEKSFNLEIDTQSQIMDDGFEEIFDYKNMRLIWPVPISVVGKKLSCCYIHEKHLKCATEIAEFYARHIHEFVGDEYIVVIDISEAAFRSEAYNVILHKMIQLLKQKYDKIYVLNIGNIHCVVAPKEVPRIEGMIKKYYPECIVDRGMEDSLVQKKWHGSTLVDVWNMAEEIHNDRIWKIIPKIMNDF